MTLVTWQRDVWRHVIGQWGLWDTSKQIRRQEIRKEPLYLLNFKYITFKELSTCILFKLCWVLLWLSQVTSIAYMHQLKKPLLGQIMACCLFGTKPSPKPMVLYYEPSWINIREIWTKIQQFSCKKINIKMLVGSPLTLASICLYCSTLYQFFFKSSKFTSLVLGNDTHLL